MRILDIQVMPNADPTYGQVGQRDGSSYCRIWEQALSQYSFNEVKVWNLSLGSDEVCRWQCSATLPFNWRIYRSLRGLHLSSRWE